jgi:hypothetical protein
MKGEAMPHPLPNNLPVGDFFFAALLFCNVFWHKAASES